VDRQYQVVLNWLFGLFQIESDEVYYKLYVFNSLLLLGAIH